MGSSRIELNRRELAGGLGDAGLFIPIAVALIAVNGLNATAVFAGAGLAYVLTALYFRVPVPVQPLKAFAAAAIALDLDAEVIAAGALLMSAAMAALSVTRLADVIAARFPLVLVRGIQASVALLLANAAYELASRGNWQGLPPIDPWVSLVIAATTCVFLFAIRNDARMPGTIIVLAGAAAVGLIVEGAPSGVSVGPEAVGLSLPDAGSFATALTALVLAQIPLTFGNSVVATADAEREYFGRRAQRVRPGRLAASIAGANAVAGLTTGLPVCHGAGGVTAHYRLGARTAGATLFVGALYMALGMTFGASLPALLHALAPGALAGMLLFVAVEHGILAARLETLSDRALAAGVGVVTLATANLAIGFAFGVVVLTVRWGWRRVRPHPPQTASG